MKNLFYTWLVIMLELAVNCMTSLLITEDAAQSVALSTAQSCVKNHSVLVCSHFIAGALSINHRQYVCYYCYIFSSHIKAASVFILFQLYS